MEPLAFRLNVLVGRFEKFGKIRVTPIIRPGNFDTGEEMTGFNFPACAHAWVRAGLGMIITPVLVRPWRWGFSLSPWWKMVYPQIVIM